MQERAPLPVQRLRCHPPIIENVVG